MRDTNYICTGYSSKNARFSYQSSTSNYKHNESIHNQIEFVCQLTVCITIKQYLKRSYHDWFVVKFITKVSFTDEKP